MVEPLPVLGAGDHRGRPPPVDHPDPVGDDEPAGGVDRRARRPHPPPFPWSRGGHGHGRPSGPGQREPGAGGCLGHGRSLSSCSWTVRISQARRSSRRAPPATGRAGPGRPSRSAARAATSPPPIGRGGRGGVLAGQPQLQPVAAPPQRRQHHPDAVDRQPATLQPPDPSRPVAGAGGGQEVVAEALHEGEHLVLVPGARVRVDGQVGDLGAEALGARGRGLGAGRLLPVAVVVAADLAHRPQQGQGQLGRLGDQLVLGHLVQQHRDPAGVDEPAGREGGQRHLAVPALGRGAPLHHRELALGEGPLRRAGQRHVQPHPVVAARVVDHDPQPQERLPGPQLGMQDGGHGGPLAGAAGPGRVEADRPPVGPAHGQLPPDRPAGDRDHLHPLGLGDHQVALGRRVVVQVAGVAPVDQPPDPVEHDLPGLAPAGSRPR